VMPTILDAAGVFGRAGWSPRAGSLLPHLQTRRDHWRAPLIMQNIAARPLGGSHFEDRAIRTEKWKMILRKFDGESTGPRAELYDMPADPAEKTDLFGSPQHREVVKELAGELSRWGKQAGDALAMELAGSV